MQGTQNYEMDTVDTTAASKPSSIEEIEIRKLDKVETTVLTNPNGA